MPGQFRLTPPKISEADVTAGCKQVCLYRGYVWLRVPAGTWKSIDGKRTITIPKGLPDYVAMHSIYPGIFIEVKRPGGKLRPEQETKIWELEAGYQLHVAVVDSPQALTEFLNQHEQRARSAWAKHGISERNF